MLMDILRILENQIEPSQFQGEKDLKLSKLINS
ncbi:hypothetical protein ZOSMA_84G00050 [Zostera marina]|uniref:Uncharacterized protein n=1 Tax=Zostera marina TaxID=29655 RepID=A0A0K9NNB2_ZOSMR|nr:hypothetical protein ZOSMA_84G00050 [Zostera marina]